MFLFFFLMHTTIYSWCKLSSDVVYLWRVNMPSRCLVLALSSIFRSLPLSLLGLRREKMLHFLLLCLPVSLMYTPSRGCCHSPLLPLLCPFTPAFICLAVSLCVRKLETAGNRQADRRREMEITLGFSNSVLFSSSIPSNLHLLLAHVFVWSL